MIEAEIRNVIQDNFSFDALELLNESHLHCGPQTETHFKLILVSSQFEGKTTVNRHRMIYQTLSEVMKKIHALALHLYTPSEWIAREQQASKSPQCSHQ